MVAAALATPAPFAFYAVIVSKAAVRSSRLKRTGQCGNRHL